MAYTDQTTGRNQRVIVMVTVGLLQGAAFVALVNGLTVKFLPRPAPPPLTGEQIRMEPLPQPKLPKPPIDKPIVQPKTTIEPRKPVIDAWTNEFVPPVAAALPIATTPVVPHIVDLAPSPPAYTPKLARPRNAPADWATSSDYPARDLREGNHGAVGFRLLIGADGKVQSCTVTKPSGFPGLDEATCEKVSHRARFEPATDESGNRVTGSYTSTVRWEIPE